MKHAFLIWIIVMGVIFTFDLVNEGNYEKPKKHWNIHDTSKTPTWDNPDNLKQIKRKYKL